MLPDPTTKPTVSSDDEGRPATGMVWARRSEEPVFAMGSLPSSYRARTEWTQGCYTMMEQVIAPRLLCLRTATCTMTT